MPLPLYFPLAASAPGSPHLSPRTSNLPPLMDSRSSCCSTLRSQVPLDSTSRRNGSCTNCSHRSTDDEFHTQSCSHPTVMLERVHLTCFAGRRSLYASFAHLPQILAAEIPICVRLREARRASDAGHPVRHLARGTHPLSPFRICGGPVGSTPPSLQSPPLPIDDTTAIYRARPSSLVPGPIDYQQ